MMLMWRDDESEPTEPPRPNSVIEDLIGILILAVIAGLILYAFTFNGIPHVAE